MRPGFHHLDGGVLTHLAGHHDAGNVVAALLEHAQSAGRVKPRHVVVRNDHVPGGILQRMAQTFSVIHPLGKDFESGLHQQAEYDVGVAFRILDL